MFSVQVVVDETFIFLLWPGFLLIQEIAFFNDVAMSHNSRLFLEMNTYPLVN